MADDTEHRPPSGLGAAPGRASAMTDPGAAFPPLTVYAPIVHGALAAGLAMSFARVGLVMKLSGPTMTVSHPVDVRMTTAEAAERYGPHVSSYEGDEIFADPPDAIIVASNANQGTSHRLVTTLRQTRPVGFVAYSGIFQSAYRYPLYDAVIANDVASRLIATHYGVPATKYFPELDAEFYRFRREPRSERVVLRSFINDYAARFPFAAAFFEECRKVLDARFGERVVMENVSREGRNETRRKMIDATATVSFKDSEGFGYAILEAMAIGRPLISQRGLSRNMAYNEFAIPGRSHLSIDRPHDLVPIVERLLDDRPWRLRLQENAAADARSIDPAAHAKTLRAAIDAVVRTTPRQQIPRPPLSIGPIVPSLDVAARQPFEQVLLGGRSASEADAG